MSTLAKRAKGMRLHAREATARLESREGKPERNEVGAECPTLPAGGRARRLRAIK